jgi:hypothetical protein
MAAPPARATRVAVATTQSGELVLIATLATKKETQVIRPPSTRNCPHSLTELQQGVSSATQSVPRHSICQRMPVSLLSLLPGPSGPASEHTDSPPTSTWQLIAIDASSGELVHRGIAGHDVFPSESDAMEAIRARFCGGKSIPSLVQGHAFLGMATTPTQVCPSAACPRALLSGRWRRTERAPPPDHDSARPRSNVPTRAHPCAPASPAPPPLQVQILVAVEVRRDPLPGGCVPPATLRHAPPRSVPARRAALTVRFWPRAGAATRCAPSAARSGWGRRCPRPARARRRPRPTARAWSGCVTFQSTGCTSTRRRATSRVPTRRPDRSSGVAPARPRTARRPPPAPRPRDAVRDATSDTTPTTAGTSGSRARLSAGGCAGCARSSYKASHAARHHPHPPRPVPPRAAASPGQRASWRLRGAAAR